MFDDTADMYLYAASTRGFYLSSVHGSAVPEDAVQITPNAYETLLAGRNAGMSIMPPDDEHDLPWLAAPEPPTPEELAVAARTKRDRLMADTDYLMMPDYPMSPEIRALWERYRQALRDITTQAGFPEDIAWPAKPQE